MKTKIISIASAMVLIATIFTACKKEMIKTEIRKDKLTHFNLSFNIDDYKNIGNTHNVLLDLLITTNDLNYKNTKDEFITSYTSRIYNFLSNQNQIHYCESDSIINVNNLEYAFDNDLYGNRDNTITYFHSISNVLNLSQSDIHYIDKSIAKFDSIQNTPNINILESLKYELNSIITDYRKIYLQPENNPDLVLGYLYTALHSLYYWENRVINLNEPILIENSNDIDGEPLESFEPQVISRILSVDALGYLYGWAKAYDAGIPNPECRIAAGRDTAAEWSAAGVASKLK